MDGWFHKYTGQKCYAEHFVRTPIGVWFQIRDGTNGIINIIFYDKFKIMINLDLTK